MLLSAPYTLVWLKSSVHSWLERAGGGSTSERNWSALVRANGLNWASQGARGGGGVFGGGAGKVGTGSQIPGPLPGVKTIAASSPSPARIANHCAATATPTAMPSVFDCPSGMAASDVTSAASSVLCCKGK